MVSSFSDKSTLVTTLFVSLFSFWAMFVWQFSLRRPAWHHETLKPIEPYPYHVPISSESKDPIIVDQYPKFISIWVWVKIRYPNNWMVNTKNRLKSVVPQVFNFDPYPYMMSIFLRQLCWFVPNCSNQFVVVVYPPVIQRGGKPQLDELYFKKNHSETCSNATWRGWFTNITNITIIFSDITVRSFSQFSPNKWVILYWIHPYVPHFQWLNPYSPPFFTVSSSSELIYAPCPVPRTPPAKPSGRHQTCPCQAHRIHGAGIFTYKTGSFMG